MCSVRAGEWQVPFPAALLEPGAGRVWSPWFLYCRLLPVDALFPVSFLGASWPDGLVTAAPTGYPLLSHRSWVPGHRGHSIWLVPRMTMFFNVQTKTLQRIKWGRIKNDTRKTNPLGPSQANQGI